MEPLFYDGSQIVCIQYTDDKPYSVVTEDGKKYDFNWCDRDGLYFEMSGWINGKDINIFGPDKVYVFEGYRLVDPHGNPLNDAELKEIEIIDEPLRLEDGLYNPFESGVESDTVWCNICKTFYPFHHVCNHLFWDDDWWSGVGYYNPIDFKEDIISFIMEYGNPEKIMEELLQNDFDITLHDFDGKDSIEEEIGYQWLYSIGDDTTPEANIQVASWIKERMGNIPF